jgi:hypothetical protein
MIKEKSTKKNTVCSKIEETWQQRTQHFSQIAAVSADSRMRHQR